MTTWWDNNSSAAGEINNSRVQNASFVDDFSDGDYDDDGASTAQGPQNISQQQNPTRKLQWQDSDLSEMSVDEATPHQSTPGSKSIKLQEKSSPVFENSLWQSSSADLAASDSGSQERDDFANPIFESTKEWEEGEMPGEEEMELVEDLPMSWEEIDEDELKEVAARLSSNAAAGPGPAVSEMFAEMNDNDDPLGLGYIDKRSCNLVLEGRQVRSMGMTGRSFTATLRPKRLGSIMPEGVARSQPSMMIAGYWPPGRQASTLANNWLNPVCSVNKNFGEEIGAAFHRFDKLLKVEAAEGDEFTPEDVAKSRTAAGGMSFVRNMANMRGNGISIKERTNIISLRKQVLPSSEEFDADIYLWRIHKNTSSKDLKKGVDRIKTLMSKHEGHIVEMIRSNFHGIVKANDGMYSVFHFLQANESPSSDQTGTSRLAKIIKEVENQSREVFSEAISRQKLLNEQQSTLAMLHRYELLFRIPAKISELAKALRFDEILREYRKARTLLKAQGWDRRKTFTVLAAQMDEAVKDALAMSMRALGNAASSHGECYQHILFVVRLQGEQVEASQMLRPLQTYLGTRRSEMKANVEKVYKRHSGQRDQKASPDASSGAGSGAGSDGSGGGRQELNSVVLFLRLEPSRGLAFARDLTLAVVGGLQELWVLLSQLGPKLRAEQGLALGSRTFLQLGMSAAEKALDEELAAYRGTLEEVLRLLVEAGEWPTLQAVTEMVFSTAQRLRDARGPPFVGLIGVLDAVMELAARVTVDAACLELAQRLSCLAEDEDWRPESLHRQLGYQGSALPDRLRDSLAAAATSVVWLHGLRPHRESSLLSPHIEPLRAAIFSGFDVFCTACFKLVQRVSDSIKKTQGGSLVNKGAMDESKQIDPALWRVLVVINNCVHVRTALLPAFAAEFETILQADGLPQDSWLALLDPCSESLLHCEEQSLEQYLKLWGGVLDRAVLECLQEEPGWWKLDFLPSPPREALYELVHVMALAQAEICSHSPGILTQAMPILLEAMAGSWSRHLQPILPKATLGAVIQLATELRFLESRFTLPSSAKLKLEATASMLGGRLLMLANGDEKSVDFRAVEGVFGRASLEKSLGSWMDKICAELLQPDRSRAAMNTACFAYRKPKPISSPLSEPSSDSQTTHAEPAKVRHLPSGQQTLPDLKPASSRSSTAQSLDSSPARPRSRDHLAEAAHSPPYGAGPETVRPAQPPATSAGSRPAVPAEQRSSGGAEGGSPIRGIRAESPASGGARPPESRGGAGATSAAISGAAAGSPGKPGWVGLRDANSNLNPRRPDALRAVAEAAAAAVACRRPAAGSPPVRPPAAGRLPSMARPQPAAAGGLQSLRSGIDSSGLRVLDGASVAVPSGGTMRIVSGQNQSPGKPARWTAAYVPTSKYSNSGGRAQPVPVRGSHPGRHSPAVFKSRTAATGLPEERLSKPVPSVVSKRSVQ